MTAHVQKLKTERAGICWLSADGYNIPCTDISYSMKINAMHAATVFTAVGSSISNPDHDASTESEVLMLRVQRSARSGSALVACTLLEEGADGSASPKVIFKGYIAASGLTYRSGATSSICIRFDCIGPAALLLAAPGSAYVPSTMDALISRLTGGRAMTSENTFTMGGSWLAGSSDADGEICRRCGQHPIARRIAICVDFARKACTAKDVKLDYSDKGDPDTLAAIGGKTNLDISGGLEFCNMAYSRAVWDGIKKGFAQNNILYSIMGTVCTDDFMLQLVPRWTVDDENDFRMEVTPVTAWDPGSPVIRFTAGEVTGITTQYTSTDPLITPDVVIANFNSVYSYTQSMLDGSALGLLGVACVDKGLQDRLRRACTAGVSGSLTTAMKELSTLRVRELSVPGWLVLVCRAAAGAAAGRAASAGRPVNMAGTGGSLYVPENVSDQAGSEVSADITSGESGSPSTLMYPRDAANVLAESLLLYHYMASNTCTVSLLPSRRFGSDRSRFLENSLGRTVEINLTGEGAVQSACRIRGELTGISFTAHYGEGGGMKYELQLTRVRNLGDGGDDVPKYACPIYTR